MQNRYPWTDGKKLSVYYIQEANSVPIKNWKHDCQTKFHVVAESSGFMEFQPEAYMYGLR